MAGVAQPSSLLVVNAGSSSLKLRLLGLGDELLASSDLPPVESDQAREGLDSFVRENDRPISVGHRVVHGGPDLRSAVAITDDVVDQLHQASELAPLHNPPALAAMQTVRELLPDVVQVACFDTAFHSGIPDQAAIYPLPWEWTEKYNLRRYGFHGLSHSYAARRSAEMLGRALEDLRIVTCHLGAGCSLAAVSAGKSVDTTMGFTPLEGLMMATRSGSVDPGALLWLQKKLGFSPEELDDALVHESGLLGVSGVSSDIRGVLEAADQGQPRARLALSIYLYRLRAAIAAMTASMNGIDAVAFTGGVGERIARVRLEASVPLSFLGIAIDPVRNEAAGTVDVDLSADDSSVSVLLVHAREELEISREVRRVLSR